MDDEIVDDSEPERLQKRKERKNKKRARATALTNKKADVIVLTDEEVEVGARDHDVSISMTSGQPKTSSQVQNPTDGDESNNLNESRLIPPQSFKSLNPTADWDSGVNTVAAPSEDEEGDRLSIGRFAFEDARKLSRSASLPTSEATLQAAVKQKETHIARHRFIADFTDIELAKITKCVSCNYEWTTRKTVVQKMLHVQICAQRKTLTDETVRILLRQEIEKTTSDPAVNGKVTSIALRPKLTKTPKTLFEDVLDNAAPKERGRRPEMLTIIRSGNETRDVICNKAQDIFFGNIPTVLGEADSHVQTQIYAPSKVTPIQESSQLPPTGTTLQEMDAAALSTGGECSSRPLTPITGLTTSSVRVPLQHPSGRSDHASVELPSLQLPALVSKTGYDSNELFDLQGHVEARSPGCRVEMQEHSSRYRYGVFADGYDSRSRFYQTNVTGMHFKKRENTETGVHELEYSQTDECSDRWEKAVKERILHNEKLYMRILRYEPIHFDIFFKIVDDQSSRGLRPRLRQLLDKLGVNFYGADAGHTWTPL